MGKYASRNFQYGRYSRIDYMKRHLCVSCSHDYRADRKNTIIRVCTEARSSCILTKVVRKCHKIISPILIRYFWTCHQVQILDWKPGFCKSADFIGQNEKKSKNQHQKINIPSSSVFLIWRLQSANPEKKVIPENQGFGSCPLWDFFKFWLGILYDKSGFFLLENS